MHSFYYFYVFKTISFKFTYIYNNVFRFLIKTEEGVCTLDIRSAEIADSGEYKCVIQDFGKEGSNETKCKVEIEEFCHKFEGQLKGKKVVEDETAVFDIGVEEDDSEVKWFKDGVEIIPDGKRLMLVQPVFTILLPTFCTNHINRNFSMDVLTLNHTCQSLNCLCFQPTNASLEPCVSS